MDTPTSLAMGLPQGTGTGQVPVQPPMAPPGPTPTPDAPDIGANSPAPAGSLTPGTPATPTPPHISALAKIGHIFHTLRGQENQYSYDKDGKLVNNPVDRKPGAVFKDMLAGALM